LHDSLKASTGLIDGFAGDLTTIHHSLSAELYAQQDGAQAAATRALEKYTRLKRRRRKIQTSAEHLSPDGSQSRA
jgi:hypothetical protein